MPPRAASPQAAPRPSRPRKGPEVPRTLPLLLRERERPEFSNRGRTIQVLTAFARFLLGFLLEEMVWRIPLVAWLRARPPPGALRLAVRIRARAQTDVARGGPRAVSVA